ncbi:MAG: leucyl aminopeptidase [Solirubrobacterales bacterium]|jgi:leucyl aminopeptidase|nr:leucyl aminopeptidase [Solirubrobacterales bacterium]
MKVEVKQIELAEVEADLLVVGLFEDGSLPPPIAEVPGAAAAKGSFKRVAVLHPAEGPPVLVVGLGERGDVDPERLRVAAAIAAKEAGRLEAVVLAWEVPDAGDVAAAEALVTGTILGAHRFDRFRGNDPDDPPPPSLESLTLIGRDEIAGGAETARISAAAQNRARDLQSTPSNFATPSFLAARAEEIAAEADEVTVEVLGPDEIAARGMGGLLAVSQGSAEEPRLIVLRYSGGGPGSGPTLGLVGKGVTFDTGGISLKPGAGMQEMKMDMSGAAAVLEAVAAIAELRLPVDLVAVVPATENMPSGTAIKPGDVITQYSGKTVEVNNTDAEGRLILADALAYAIELGAERVIDLATLTGAVLVALGSTYAAVISNDDDLAGEVTRAGEESGELVWRLPLHPEYREMMKGTVADLSNLASTRKAGTITAASFLEEFVEDTPWAHVDIAGTAWDVGRAYTGKDASGFGVRLLVQLARDHAG